MLSEVFDWEGISAIILGNFNTCTYLLKTENVMRSLHLNRISNLFNILVKCYLYQVSLVLSNV